MVRIVEVPAGDAAVIELVAGEVLRIVDLMGHQIGDLVALAAGSRKERLSTAETINFNGWSARVRPGTILYSNRPRPLLTVLTDTSSGKHDLFFAACTPFFYEYYGGGPGHNNCHDNLIRGLQPFGIEPENLPNPVNLFQDTEIDQDGSIVVGAPGAEAGQYIELRAEIDVIIAVSSCPVDLVALGTGDWIPTPLRLEARLPKGE